MAFLAINFGFRLLKDLRLSIVFLINRKQVYFLKLGLLITPLITLKNNAYGI